MPQLPPLPPGFTLGGPQPPERDPNLLKPLFDAGIEPTNGYRTPADIERLRRQGYKPASNSAHLDGDAVDLTPGKTRFTLRDVQARAEAIAKRWPGGSALNEGDHIHLKLPGWGMAPGTPGTPNFGLPPLPPGATLQQRGSLAGTAHDGDTIRLTDGRNGRLFGLDAFELGQQGRRPDGSLVPLGTQGRDFMLSHIAPGMFASPTGAQTYGRPVVTLGDPQSDPGKLLLRNGLGMAEPDYLKGSPQFSPYMEAERQARLNRLGGFGTNAESPSQYRHKDGPWQGAEPGKYGEGIAVFKDEPTPFQGLQPGISKGYTDIWQDMASRPEDLIAYAAANGFNVDPATVREQYAERNKPKHYPTDEMSYVQPPKLLTDVGDGAAGAAVRGFGDPFNLLDELGGVADTLTGVPSFDGPRENVWNSDRRFGDILWNNIDQNRSILANDDEAHPYARFGGQLASGLAIPVAGVEGVASRATAKALEEGASRFAAEEAGKKALALRLGAVGAGEGAVIGGGAGEGGVGDRLPGAVVGAVGGAALGVAGGKAIELGQRGFNALRSSRNAVPDAAGPPLGGPLASEAVAPPSMGGGSENAAMAADSGPSLVGPVRQRDYINTGDLPPLPQGFSLDGPLGGARNINERLSPEAMASLAEGVDPSSVLPRPGNRVESLDEAIKANPGRFEELKAPNELDALPVHSVRPANGGLYNRIKLRGPFDITKTLRQLGGVKDQGGDLAHLGITNAPRRLPFGGNEQFLGKLIDNEKGMTLDQAGEKLHELGYFQERPTVAEVIDALHGEHLGDSRYLPEDLAQVDEFHQLQSQRYGIENAQAEGRPFAEDRGEVINLDDLVANTPPASAYEEMPRLTGRVGNINLDRLGKPEDVAQLIDQVSNRVGGFSAAARGRITNEETRNLGAELGIKPEDLLKRRQGQALNAEQLYASRALVQRSRETVVRFAKRADGGDNEDLIAFRKAWLRHVALEEHIAGATAEAGRALQQFNMLAHGADASGEAVRAYLRGGGGRDSIEDAARAIVDLAEDPAKANHFMREAVKPRWRDKFNELWINSLLSGPRTHAVNMVGNALTSILSFPELATTAAIGKFTRSKDRALFGEVGARAAGLADSSVDALRAARTAFKTGEPLDASTKVEATNHQAIGGTLGRIIRTPTRALTAADEFWKALLSSAELRQIAYRKAKVEAAKPEDFQARYAALSRVPSEDMLTQAHAAARYYTFQQPLGEVGRYIQGISNKSIVGKILIPFVRTPINILKFAGERSVFGLAMPEVRAALRAGGRSRDEALAKITLGAGLSTAAVVAAMDGRISGGGPGDPGERASLLQSGWQPYSIRIGDHWYSYQRFDPVSTLIGVAADFAEAGKWATKKEADTIALNLGLGIAKNITNKTWLSGLSDAFDVLSDPERYGKSYVQRMVAAMAVPAIASQTAQALDPNLRNARTVMDAIKSRVPVLSRSVPARRNVWGEPVAAGGGVPFSPFYVSKVNTAPLNQEIARLRVPLSMPQRHIMVDGQNVQLSPQQFDEYVQLAGGPAKSAIDQEIRSPEWRSMSDPDRVQFVKDTLTDFRDTARQTLVERHPELSGQQSPPAAPSLPPMPQMPRSRPPVLPPLPPGFQLAR